MPRSSYHVQERLGSAHSGVCWLFYNLLLNPDRPSPTLGRGQTKNASESNKHDDARFMARGRVTYT